MAECNSTECNEASNLSATLLNNQQFILNKINEIKDYFIAEIKERQFMSKRLTKYIAFFDYFDKSLIVLSATSGSISIVSFATVIGTPVGIASASLSFTFSLSKEIKKKHNKIIMLARSKLNSTESKISEAVMNNQISHEYFGPFHIIIKDIQLYTNHMNVLVDDNELLKYIEIWNKIEALFNKTFNNKGFHSKPIDNNEYMKTKISSYNENFHGNKRLKKDEYYGHSVLLLESISEVENIYYPRTFIDKFFECNSIECNSVKKHNKNSLLKELVQIVDWSDDESTDES